MCLHSGFFLGSALCHGFGCLSVSVWIVVAACRNPLLERCHQWTQPRSPPVAPRQCMWYGFPFGEVVDRNGEQRVELVVMTNDDMMGFEKWTGMNELDELRSEKHEPGF